MLVVVTGGSGSGKSEFAENIAKKLYENKGAKHLFYVATMKPYGKEVLQKIQRHKALRADKGFETIECYSDISSLDINENSVVLLECMSNLVANEIFDYKNINVVGDVLKGVNKILKKSTLVVVTNEIFADGISYDEETVDYMKKLGEINCSVVECSDMAVEVVCGIPIYIKGGDEYAV